MLNLSLVTALVVVGLAAHSLAVFAAGADYLADAAAIGVSLLAIWIASRPHGYANATTVAALVNAGWLLILNIAIVVAAIWHLVEGTHRVEVFGAGPVPAGSGRRAGNQSRRGEAERHVSVLGVRDHEVIGGIPARGDVAQFTVKAADAPLRYGDASRNGHGRGQPFATAAEPAGLGGSAAAAT